VERKYVLRAETEEDEIPMVMQRTPHGLIVVAIGTEESRDTDDGEKVATAVARITNFLEMCGY